MPTKCKHHEICGLNTYVGMGGFCILHSRKPTKGEDFEKALEEHRKNKGDNFKYFYFPYKIDFSSVTFAKGANFQEAEFKGTANFNNAKFAGAADFREGNFRYKANFDNAKFNGEADFRGVEFQEVANFGKATFAEEASFRGAKFTNRADFYGAIFAKKASFCEAAFNEGTDFSYAKFTNEADFTKTLFANETDFIQAAFNEGTDFSYAKFTKDVSFSGATFTKKAQFNWATFTKDVDFGVAKFTETAYFVEATFTGEGNFFETLFIGVATFAGAKFTNRAVFYGAIFDKEASFGDAMFMRGASFEGTIFRRKAHFSNSHLFGRTLFIGSKDARGKTYNFIFSNCTVFLKNLNINPTNVIIFRDADLSQCLFQGTRVDKIEFTGVKWTKLSGKLGYSRTGVYDEKVLLDSIKNKKKTKNKDKDDFGWEHVERVYRDLKTNHKESGDHERAGDFHYGEKEMRRRNPRAPLMHRFFLNLYRILSGYGERYLRPLGWVFGLLIVCTIGYMFLGIAPKDGAPFGIANTECWFKVGLYSLQVMTLQRPTELQPIGVWSTAIKTFQSIVGPIILGLFALALRQRLKR